MQVIFSEMKWIIYMQLIYINLFYDGEKIGFVKCGFTIILTTD
jgi:hypothetical protein